MAKMIGDLLNSILDILVVAVLLNTSNQIDRGMFSEYLIDYGDVGVVRVEDMKLCRGKWEAEVIDGCSI